MTTEELQHAKSVAAQADQLVESINLLKSLDPMLAVGRDAVWREFGTGREVIGRELLRRILQSGISSTIGSLEQALSNLSFRLPEKQDVEDPGF